MKSKFFGFAAAALCATASAADSITIDSVKQRWPWNDKVDVTYTIGTDNVGKRVGKVTITAEIEGKTYTVYNGPFNENTEPGTHTITWEEAPAGVRSDSCRMTATFDSAAVPEGDDYMIVNLVDGSVEYEGLFSDDVSVAGVSGQELSNVRYNCDKYKTSHMAFRKVPKGTYKAKRGTGTFTEWTTDKDYYIAIFDWTHAQYGYVIKRTDGTDATPWGDWTTMTRRWNVSQIRASIDPSGTVPEYTLEALIAAKNWVPLLFLNAKTGMHFDIPTELMHEIACRAGTETTYYWGTDANSFARYAICGKSNAAGHYDSRYQYGDPVGTRLPNNWGLYDMVGNDWQWCRNYNKENAPADVFTPGTKTNNDGWIVRGQNLYAAGSVLTSDARSAATSNSGTGYSFRAAYIVPAAEAE